MEIGQIVERPVDVYFSSQMMTGVIVRKYSAPQKIIGDLVLGPYPELYAVQWFNGYFGRGYLPHGISLVTDKMSVDTTP